MNEDAVPPKRSPSIEALLRNADVTHLLDALTYPDRIDYNEVAGITVFKCPDCRKITARSESDSENVYACSACDFEGTRRRLERCVRESVRALERFTRFDPDLIDVLLDSENGELL